MRIPQASSSVGKESVDLRIDAVRELRGARLSGHFSINCSGPDAYYRSVGRSVLQSVGNEQELSQVFARNDPSMRLIPIENHIQLRSLRHQVFVCKDGNPALRTDLHARGMNWLPARAG